MFQTQTTIKKLIRYEHYGDYGYFDLNRLVHVGMREDLDHIGKWSIFIELVDNEVHFEYECKEDAEKAMGDIVEQIC